MTLCSFLADDEPAIYIDSLYQA